MFDDEISITPMYSTLIGWCTVDLNRLFWEKFLVGSVTGRGAWSWLWDGKIPRITSAAFSQWSSETVCFFSLWWDSVWGLYLLQSKVSVERLANICFPFGIVQLCGRMLCNYRCMRGCPVAATVVCMGKPVFTRDVGPLTRLSPPFLFGLRKFPLRRLICGSTLCKCLWCPVLICVYSDAQTVKSHLAILYHSGHCVTTGGTVIKNCTPTIIFACNMKQCGNALLDLFSY